MKTSTQQISLTCNKNKLIALVQKQVIFQMKQLPIMLTQKILCTLYLNDKSQLAFKTICKCDKPLYYLRVAENGIRMMTSRSVVAFFIFSTYIQKSFSKIKRNSEFILCHMFCLFLVLLRFQQHIFCYILYSMCTIHPTGFSGY